MAYKTILTNYGLAQMAAAAASGVPINLTAVAVGDGNGNPVTPTQSQTGLVREVYRAAPNRVYQDSTTPTMFTVEMLVPSTVGGFTVREIGVFDSSGGLFAVANTPDSYKPQGDGSEGSFSDTAIRVQFLVSNASVVTLQIDPNLAVATQQWANNTFNTAKIIPGGTTGQILAKHSNADGDVIWKDPTDANVVVDTIEETQTLAAGQTVVNLTTTITYGLCVFIEGVRLRNDEWTPDPTIGTKLTLAQSYPDGTKFSAVNNLPAGSAPQPLVQSKNLSDVPDPSAARTNLNVYSKTETDQKAPTGTVGLFAGSSAPVGWLKCNGAAISRTAYAALFAAIGTAYGAGDGSNTFNLPDLRGEFVRGWDDGKGTDAGRAIGSFQGDAIRNITGTAGHFPDRFNSATGAFGLTAGGGSSGTGTGSGDSILTLDASKQVPTANENRPRNIAMLYMIKY